MVTFVVAFVCVFDQVYLAFVNIAGCRSLVCPSYHIVFSFLFFSFLFFFFFPGTHRFKSC